MFNSWTFNLLISDHFLNLKCIFLYLKFFKNSWTYLFMAISWVWSTYFYFKNNYSIQPQCNWPGCVGVQSIQSIVFIHCASLKVLARLQGKSISSIYFLIFLSFVNFPPGVSFNEAKQAGLASSLGTGPMPREMSFPVPKGGSWHDLYDYIRWVASPGWYSNGGENLIEKASDYLDLSKNNCLFSLSVK